MSTANQTKDVRGLPRSKYAEARREIVRDQSKPARLPSNRPLPSPVMTMAAKDYAAAKRAVSARAERNATAERPTPRRNPAQNGAQDD